MNNTNYTVSIVIPNWNGAYLLKKHLPAVLRAAGNSEVVIVDDASTDKSIQLLHNNFFQVRIIGKKNHEGFASTVNTGVARAYGDIVVLLNTDVEPEKDFLKPLLSHFNDPTVFAVGCLEKSVEGGEIILRGRGEGMWKRGFFVHWRGEINEANTAWVSGGSGAFRKSIWNKLGGMDPLFNPFYWEDIDLSYRALKAGYRLVFEAKSVIGHFHEEGKIQSEFSPRDVRKIAYRNQFIFIWKNVSDPILLFLHAVWTPIRLIQALMSGDPLMILGYITALLRLPLILSSRRLSLHAWKKADREIPLK